MKTIEILNLKPQTYCEKQDLQVVVVQLLHQVLQLLLPPTGHHELLQVFQVFGLKQALVLLVFADER